MELIASRESIRLAHHSIKGSKGSHMAGVNGKIIKHLSRLNEEEYTSLIQKQLHWYKLRPVKRAEMRKPNGEIRPLGVPTIADRIIQQCIPQILELICEAKFHDSSYGFRPNRSMGHVIAGRARLMQIQHLHYVVDIDIQGFFDDVYHVKLMR